MNYSVEILPQALDNIESAIWFSRCSGVTGLKLWAFRTLQNTINNLLSDRVTHSFSRVEPVGWALPTS